MVSLTFKGMIAVAAFSVFSIVGGASVARAETEYQVFPGEIVYSYYFKENLCISNALAAYSRATGKRCTVIQDIFIPGLSLPTNLCYVLAKCDGEALDRFNFGRTERE